MRLLTNNHPRDPSTIRKSVQQAIDGRRPLLTQAPVIPVLEEVDWFEYNATNISGFPTASNPYAQPGLYNQPDWGYVLDALKPKA